MPEISERVSAVHVPDGVRSSRARAGVAHAPLRSGHHRAPGVPVRPVPGQQSGRTARGHRVQPDADLVPGLVRQPVQPGARDAAPLAVPETGHVRPAFLEPRRLRPGLSVFQVHRFRGHGHGTRVLRRPSAGRRNPAPERVPGVPEHAFQLRSAQTDGDQLQGNRRHTPEADQTVARRKTCCTAVQNQTKTVTRILD